MHLNTLETLTGLSTVRAYGEQARFVRNADQGLDMENRAYYMLVSSSSYQFPPRPDNFQGPSPSNVG
jgi:ATP-binding cassette, subfamily C (CFTR/MRP), member 1